MTGYRTTSLPARCVVCRRSVTLAGYMHKDGETHGPFCSADCHDDYPRHRLVEAVLLAARAWRAVEREIRPLDPVPGRLLKKRRDARFSVSEAVDALEEWERNGK